MSGGQAALSGIPLASQVDKVSAPLSRCQTVHSHTSCCPPESPGRLLGVLSVRPSATIRNSFHLLPANLWKITDLCVRAAQVCLSVRDSAGQQIHSVCNKMLYYNNHLFKTRLH